MFSACVFIIYSVAMLATICSLALPSLEVCAIITMAPKAAARRRTSGAAISKVFDGCGEDREAEQEVKDIQFVTLAISGPANKQMRESVVGFITR